MSWRKSRSSENDANCVEVLGTLDELRDSKNPGATLRVDVEVLVRVLKVWPLG
jgi:hypothetical protein